MTVHTLIVAIAAILGGVPAGFAAAWLERRSGWPPLLILPVLFAYAILAAAAIYAAVTGLGWA